MLIGASLYACFFGMVATLLIRSDAAWAEYTQKMDLLDRYMAATKLPIDLRSRIRANAEYKFTRQSVLNESELLRDLPYHLRREISMATAGELLRSTPIFADAGDPLISAVADELTTVMALEGELVIREGEVGACMYFIRDGSLNVEVIDSNGEMKSVKTLHSGSYFGEFSLLHNVRRTASVRANEDTALFSLSKRSFDAIRGNFPEAMYAVRNIARNRLDHLALERRKLQAQKDKCAFA